MKNYTMKVILWSLLILVTLANEGCALFLKSDPNANIKINAAQYLNPDINGHAAPVVVTIYQLKSPYTFKQANYDALAGNSAEVLGADLIDKSIIEVRPSSQDKIEQAISPSTKYLGIVAAYRNIDQSTWHTVVKVENDKGKTTTVNLVLESQAISATVNYHSGFGAFL